MFVDGRSCLTGVLFVLFEYATLAEVFRNPRGTGFCHKFSECRLDARKQFERCAGGFMAMVLAKQGTLDKLKHEGADMRPTCEEIFTTLIDRQVRPYYDQLEDQTFKCARENTGIAFSLDRTQELVCLAIQDEVMTSKADLDGVGSEDECRQVYESDLRRCEMIKECCPSYEHCRTKVETESGIHFKERQIAVQFEKCLRDSGFKYKSETKAHPEKSLKGDPLPGEVRDESDEEAEKEGVESENKRFAPTQPTTPHHNYNGRY
ncbi:hypothetical protein AAVH_05332 [Aphelenchoides avenae]|nr:hypothetical protein AAVH_05332 [Aphelenchus avenae]